MFVHFGNAQSSGVSAPLMIDEFSHVQDVNGKKNMMVYNQKRQRG